MECGQTCQFVVIIVFFTILFVGLTWKSLSELFHDVASHFVICCTPAPEDQGRIETEQINDVPMIVIDPCSQEIPPEYLPKIPDKTKLFVPETKVKRKSRRDLPEESLGIARHKCRSKKQHLPLQERRRLRNRDLERSRMSKLNEVGDKRSSSDDPNQRILQSSIQERQTPSSKDNIYYRSQSDDHTLRKSQSRFGVLEQRKPKYGDQDRSRSESGGQGNRNSELGNRLGMPQVIAKATTSV